MTREMIDCAMHELSAEAKRIYGRNLKGVILFGSCARGDFEDDSDVDVMVLLDVPRENLMNEREKLKPVLSAIDRKYDYELLISVDFQSSPEFNYWVDVLPFYQNVRREGVAYA